MKLTKSILVVTLATGAAIAQSGIAPIDAARRAANASSARAEQTNKVINGEHQATTAENPSPAKTPFSPKSAPKAALAPAKTTAAVPAKGATATPATNKGTTAPATEAAKTVQPEMRKIFKDGRDPFVSIIRTDKAGTIPCASGKKCLVIGEIVFRGIMKSSDSIIAVVENPQKKTYFLRENDPVFNGNVLKITSDMIVFREQVTDRAGRTSTREITKHLNTRPIA